MFWLVTSLKIRIKMMFNFELITSVLNFLKGLIKPISVFIGSYFIYLEGKKEQKLNDLEQSNETIKESKKINSGVHSLSDDELDSLL